MITKKQIFCLLLGIMVSLSKPSAQIINNYGPLIYPKDQAFVVDYIAEGAGASHLFGFFYLDIDTDKDGKPDFEESGPLDDLDGDGLVNQNDPDDDNDGILDGVDTKPASVSNSMAASFFAHGSTAESEGGGDYWKFVPNNTINSGIYSGYFEHPGAYLYVDNDSDNIPDILQYNIGANKMPPGCLDQNVLTENEGGGDFYGLLGEWEYSGSPGSTATERTHLNGATIFYICDDDTGNFSTSNYTDYTPYSGYSDTYSNLDGQVGVSA